MNYNYNYNIIHSRSKNFERNILKNILLQLPNYI